ncbi:uncharacterized protein BX663DRAFT_497071 [Cokeromyces recurvatus]|uniref:uncharacterized protein n=1 Tax=Cokeromyces recurvatus TaxID=90255 RepID=UPI00221F42DE|nr:uncharacterized protein BX663DRAFT_497071 [Cokeromyces recurvatus]KAI7906609.1 hypothetical protein BX663DRAFT_497071 [Cokeromyces recurvatus]
MCPTRNALFTLEDTMTCIICSEFIIEATIIIDCGHAFCRECLEKHLMFRNDCPTCLLESSMDRASYDYTKRALQENWQSVILADKRPYSSISEDDQLEDEYNSTASSSNKKLKSFQEGQENTNSKKRSYQDISDSNDVKGYESDDSSCSKKSKLYIPSPTHSTSNASTLLTHSSSSVMDNKQPKDSALAPLPLHTDSDCEESGSVISIDSLFSGGTFLDAKKEIDALVSGDEEDQENSNTCLSGSNPTSQTANKISHACIEAENKASSADTSSSFEKTSFIENQQEESLSMIDKKAIVDEAAQQNESQDDKENLSVEKKLDIDSSDEEFGENWSCPECGLENKPYIQTCGVCRVSRDSGVIEPATIEKDEDVQQTLKIEDKVHILLTGLTPAAQKQVDRILTRDSSLKVVVHTQFEDSVTHLVTSVNNRGLCRRTIKYCHGLLTGKWIVDVSWLLNSLQARKWLPMSDFEVQGDQQSGLTHAPKRARLNGGGVLLKGMTFYLCGVFKGKHSKADLLALCKSGGGQVIIRRPTNGRHETGPEIVRNQPVVIVSGEEKRRPTWLKNCQVRDSSWLVQCISTLCIE